VEDLKSKGTQALLIIRGDELITEWYAPGRTASDKHSTASLAKAIVGGMSLALVIDEGRITINDPAARFVPQWQNDPLKSKILVRHLGSHTSGIKDAWVDAEAARGVNQKYFSGWEGEYWRWRDRDDGQPQDAFTLARDVAPVVFEPGTAFQYSNPGIAMLSYCMTASLKGGPQTDIRSLLSERLMRPLGVPDEEWSCGYQRTEVIEGLPLVICDGGGNYSPRAIARIGRLVLREGNWEGKQLISREALRAVIGSAGHPGECGMGWWTNAGGRFQDLPKDAVWGAGAGHKILLVVPSLKLIVVRMGQSLGDPQWSPDVFHRDLEVHLINPLMAAIDDGSRLRSAMRSRARSMPAQKHASAFLARSRSADH
jgi:CubicO group peptidase (beta-lactamase class C family)